MVSLIGVLLTRVLWIQTSALRSSGTGSETESGESREDLVTQSVLQRERRLLLDSGRGDFLDRTGKPLTGETYSSLLVFPVHSVEKEDSAEIQKLISVLGITRNEWSSFRKSLNTPRFWSGAAGGSHPIRLTGRMVETIQELRLDGLAVVPYERRYLDPYPAAQLIGFIGQNPDRVRTEFAPMLKEGRLQPDSLIGSSGLERTFERLLSGLGGTYISLYTDAKSRPIPGIGYRLHMPQNPYYPLQVITTLDGGIQGMLEQLADRCGLKDGAVVVLDAHTAELVAMVSRPAYNPEKVAPSSDAWSNRALKAAVPGSVFKTVVAAAALEHGVVHADDIFECKGALGKYHFTCWKAGGHGRLTFREGFAQSCNIVFAEVMKKLKPEQLEATADKLGIDRTAGWEGELLRYSSFHQLDAEEEGRLWSNGADRSDEGASLQTAIGQRDVRMTPLQAANMVVTLLNGGDERTVRAVKEVRYRTGRVLAEFPEQHVKSGNGELPEGVAKQLTEWMKDVVESGTGTALQSAIWDLAGKSGTAQAPEGGVDKYNQWFVGYGPVQAPKYAVAVVSLKQKQSGPEAVTLFRQVMDVLALPQK